MEPREDRPVLLALLDGAAPRGAGPVPVGLSAKDARSLLEAAERVLSGRDDEARVALKPSSGTAAGAGELRLSLRRCPGGLPPIALRLSFPPEPGEAEVDPGDAGALLGRAAALVARRRRNSRRPPCAPVPPIPWRALCDEVAVATVAGHEMMACVNNDGRTFRLCYLDRVHPGPFATIGQAMGEALGFARGVLEEMLDEVEATGG